MYSHLEGVISSGDCFAWSHSSQCILYGYMTFVYYPKVNTQFCYDVVIFRENNSPYKGCFHEHRMKSDNFHGLPYHHVNKSFSAQIRSRLVTPSLQELESSLYEKNPLHTICELDCTSQRTTKTMQRAKCDPSPHLISVYLTRAFFYLVCPILHKFSFLLSAVT